MDNVDRMLQGIITHFGDTSSYPGRIYGMYEWSADKNRWGISTEWLITYRITKLESILKKI